MSIIYFLCSIFLKNILQEKYIYTQTQVLPTSKLGVELVKKLHVIATARKNSFTLNYVKKA